MITTVTSSRYLKAYCPPSIHPTLAPHAQQTELPQSNGNLTQRFNAILLHSSCRTQAEKLDRKSFAAFSLPKPIDTKIRHLRRRLSTCANPFSYCTTFSRSWRSAASNLKILELWMCALMVESIIVEVDQRSLH